MSCSTLSWIELLNVMLCYVWLYFQWFSYITPYENISTYLQLSLSLANDMYFNFSSTVLRLLSAYSNRSSNSGYFFVEIVRFLIYHILTAYFTYIVYFRLVSFFFSVLWLRFRFQIFRFLVRILLLLMCSMSHYFCNLLLVEQGFLFITFQSRNCW